MTINNITFTTSARSAVIETLVADAYDEAIEIAMAEEAEREALRAEEKAHERAVYDELLKAQGIIAHSTREQFERGERIFAELHESCKSIEELVDALNHLEGENNQCAIVYNTVSTYSDLFKEVYGVRPRFQYTPW